ncbi:hypothetical protein J6590_101725 [Homalodisca vitripennis]|nr:hypothetical protein J6590_101725 [Homalodisca vitripennis]
MLEMKMKVLSIELPAPSLSISPSLTIALRHTPPPIHNRDQRHHDAMHYYTFYEDNYNRLTARRKVHPLPPDCTSLQCLPLMSGLDALPDRCLPYNNVPLLGMFPRPFHHTVYRFIFSFCYCSGN